MCTISLKNIVKLSLAVPRGERGRMTTSIMITCVCVCARACVHAFESVLIPSDCLDKSLQFFLQDFESSLPLPVCRTTRMWLAQGHQIGFVSKGEEELKVCWLLA